MRILVCGGRAFNDREYVFECLDLFVVENGPVTSLVHGAQRGADTLAGEWAYARGIRIIRCPADWNSYGRSAGHIRNVQMLGYNPDIVLAFPGGPGTANMKAIACKSGIPVREFDPTC